MLLGILQLPLPLLQTLALAFLLLLASAISMLLRLLGRCDFFLPLPQLPFPGFSG